MPALVQTAWGGRADAMLASLLLAASTGAFAQLPSGATVVAGQASISQPSAQRQIIRQGSDKAIIDWRSFSIGSGSAVNFVQPDSSSVALNRVVGGDPSSILGSLSANGQIFLVNPKGIYFGRGAALDTAGLLATTLDIRNEDFLAGRYVFSRTPSAADGATVANEGLLRARDGGYIVLTGDRVANSLGGSIEARLGTVALAAGNKITLDINGDSLVRFSVDATTADRLGGVKNLGQIASDGGRVLMTAMVAREATGAVVNNSGAIRAAGIEERDGAIILTAGTGEALVSGSLDASGARGGRVEVTGERVAVLDGAVIDASGQQGGGAVLVGGGRQGANAAVANAAATYFGRNASIRADAIRVGAGGTVVLWADGTTRAYGSIFARGGAAGGNGGFVETSGKQFLDVAGARVDTSAANGERGQWLLDPTNITITHGAAVPSVFPGGIYTNGGGASSSVSDGDINGNLLATDVTISSSGVGLGTGNITLNGTADAGGAVAISSASGRNLALTAANAIIFNGGATVSLGAGNLFLTAGAGITQAAGSTISANGLSVQGTGSFTLGQASDVRSNKVGTVAADVTGNFSFTNVNGDPASTLAVGTVNGVSGVQSHGGDIAVYDDSTAGLQINAAVSSGSASSGTVALRASEASTSGFQPLAINAAVTGGTVKLDGADNISQTAAGVISAGDLVVRYAAGTNQDSADLSTAANAVSRLAAAVTGTKVDAGNGFAFRNAAGSALQVTAVDGVSGITSKGGDISIRADSLNLSQSVDASGVANAAVSLSSSDLARPIVLGGVSATALSLTQSALDLVKTGASGVLRIGETGNTGGMTLAGNIASTSNWNTLSLKTGAALTQSGGTLTVPNLAAYANGSISLANAATSAGTVALRSNGALSYTYGSGTLADLNVTSIDGITGASSLGGPIDLASVAALNLSQDVNAGSGTIALTAHGSGINQSGGAFIAAGLKLVGSGAFNLDQAANQVGTLAANVAGGISYTDAGLLSVGTVGGVSGITTGGATVTLTADRMAVNQDITTAGGGITLKPLTATQKMDLGSASDATPATLELSAAEVGRLKSGAGSLTFGGAGIDGSITVSAPTSTTAPVSLLNGTGGIQFNSTLATSSGGVTVVSAGAVSDNAGTTGISASSLNLQAQGGISLTGSGNSFATLYLANTGGGAVSISNSGAGLSVDKLTQAGAGAVAVTTSGTLSVNASPIDTGGNALTLSSGGAMSLLQDLTASGANVKLNAATGGVAQGAGNITAAGLELTGSGNFSLSNVKTVTAGANTTSSYNNVATLAADVNGTLAYRDEDALTLGTVGGTTGVNTHGNSLSIETGGAKTTSPASVVGGTLSLASSLNVGGGTMSLSANNAAISQTGGAITANSLTVAAGGSATLNQAGNNVNTVSIAAGGAVSYRDADAVTVGGTGVSSGSSNGDVSLASAGLMTLTQNVNAGNGAITLNSGAGANQTGGSLTANKLLLLGAGPYALTQAASSPSSGTGNDVATIAGSFAGDLTYLDRSSLTIGSVGGVNGLTSTTGGAIDVQTLSGNVTVSQPVVSAAVPSRGDVSLVAAGSMAVNADVRGNQVRLNSGGFMSQGGGVVEGTTLLLGASNNADAAIWNRVGTPTLGELVRYFSGATVLDEDLTATKLIIYGLDGATSFALAAGRKITASSLLLGGAGSFNLDNSGNDIQTLAAFRPWGSNSGYGIRFADSGAFALGTISWNTRLTHTTSGGANWWWDGTKVANGVLNNGYWPTYGFGGSGGDVRLTAGGVGAITLNQNVVTGGLLALTSPGGVTSAAGATITAGSLKLIGQGNFSLTNANAVGTMAAQVTDASLLSFTNSADVTLGTVDGLAGVALSGPGEATLNVASTGGAMTVAAPVSVVTAGAASPNSAPAHVNLSSFRNLNVQANVSAHGGSASSGVGAEVNLRSDVGGILQTAGSLAVTDDGPSTAAAQAPHSARVSIRAGANNLDAGSNIANCTLVYGGNCGQVRLNDVSATSDRGSAVIDVFSPNGLISYGTIAATSQTAPRISLAGDVQDSGGNLVSSSSLDVRGATTVSQPGGTDVNARSVSETAGLLLSGYDISTSAALASNSSYGVSVSAQRNISFGGNVSTTANDGVSLSTGTNNGWVGTTSGARLTAKQLGLTGGRDRGIFNLATDIQSLQVLGARALTIDNSAHTGMLLATVLGRVSPETTDPSSGTVTPAVDKPVGAVSITTGGDLTVFSFNNLSGATILGTNYSWDLNGNLTSAYQPMKLVANNIVETPGAFNVKKETEITLRPYNAARAIEVRNLPATAAVPGTTYYLGGTFGLLNQFNPDARLIIGGPGYSGNITVGSRDESNNWPSTEQFTLGRMSITFQTTGRVYNRFSPDPMDTPSNWNGLSLPYSPYPPISCAFGQACIAKLSSNEIIVRDSLSNGVTQRYVRIAGQGDGTGGFTPSTGSTSSSSGGSGSGGGGDSGSSGGSSSSSSGPPSDPGTPGGGGSSGAPSGVATTVVAATTPGDSGGTLTGTVDTTSTSGTTTGTTTTLELSADGGSGSGGGSSLSGVGDRTGGSGGTSLAGGGTTGGPGDTGTSGFSGTSGTTDSTGTTLAGGDTTGTGGAGSGGAGDSGLAGDGSSTSISLAGGGDTGAGGSTGSGLSGGADGGGSGTGAGGAGDSGLAGDGSSSGTTLAGGGGSGAGGAGSSGLSGGADGSGGAGTGAGGPGELAGDGSSSGTMLAGGGGSGTGGAGSSGLSGGADGSGGTGTGAGGAGDSGLAGDGSSSGTVLAGGGGSGTGGAGSSGLSGGADGGDGTITGTGGAGDSGLAGDGSSSGATLAGAGDDGIGGANSSGFSGESAAMGGAEGMTLARGGETGVGSGRADSGVGDGSGSGGAAGPGDALVADSGEGSGEGAGGGSRTLGAGPSGFSVDAGGSGEGGEGTGEERGTGGTGSVFASGDGGEGAGESGAAGQKAGSRDSAGEGSHIKFAGGGEGDAEQNERMQLAQTDSLSGSEPEPLECAADRNQEMRTVSTGPSGGKPLVLIKGAGVRFASHGCGQSGVGGGRSP